jgi:hypothetical protein
MKQKLQCKRSDKLITAIPMKNYLAVGLKHGKQTKRQVTQNKYQIQPKESSSYVMAKRTSHAQRRNLKNEKRTKRLVLKCGGAPSATKLTETGEPACIMGQNRPKTGHISCR